MAAFLYEFEWDPVKAKTNCNKHGVDFERAAQVFRDPLAWWVEGGWLHYITGSGAHEQVKLDAVDRDFTREINRQRRVPLELPEAPGS